MSGTTVVDVDIKQSLSRAQWLPVLPVLASIDRKIKGRFAKFIVISEKISHVRLSGPLEVRWKAGAFDGIFPNAVMAAATLIDKGLLVCKQKGHIVDIRTVKGPIRLQIAARR